MLGVFSTEIEDFTITIYGCLIIFSTVLAEMALHEPGLCVSWIYGQNAIEKDFCNIPTFFRDCSRSVGSINANMGITTSLTRH